MLNCFHTLCAKCIRKVAQKMPPPDSAVGATAMVAAGSERERLVVDCPICRYIRMTYEYLHRDLK